MELASGEGWQVLKQSELVQVIITRASGAAFFDCLVRNSPSERRGAYSAMLMEAQKRIEKRRVREAFEADWELK